MLKWRKHEARCSYIQNPWAEVCEQVFRFSTVNLTPNTYFHSNNFITHSTKYLTWSPNYKEIFWDLDGSLAGEPDSMIIKYYSFNDWPNDTTHLPDWNYESSLLVHNHTRARRVEIDNVTPHAQLDSTGKKLYDYINRDRVTLISLCK